MYLTTAEVIRIKTYSKHVSHRHNKETTSLLGIMKPFDDNFDKSIFPRFYVSLHVTLFTHNFLKGTKLFEILNILNRNVGIHSDKVIVA